MKTLLVWLLFVPSAWAHVPVLLQPVEGVPIAGHFLSHSEVSRAVYSELTKPGDISTITWIQAKRGPSLLQLFSPKCPNIPRYEDFQPAALLIRGEAPWKKEGESTARYVQRVKEQALAHPESDFPRGRRPVYEEKNAGHSLWVGAEWKGELAPGTYTLVIYSPDEKNGNFVLGLNEKEDWNADLWRYVGEILPKINRGLCDAKGYSGRMQLGTGE